MSALNNAGGTVTSKVEIAPGIYQLEYQLPGGVKAYPKTVGNELGANSHWVPGGQTKGVIPEATIDPVPVMANSIWCISRRQTTRFRN